MNKKVLVAFATTHGSTKEVAEFVAEELRGQGLAVDLLPARDARSLGAFRAVVLGSPLYMFHLNREALQFLSRHRRVIEGGLPLALFAGGPIEKGEEDEWVEVRRQLDSELAKFPWLRPESVHLVGGKFDPAALRFPWNLIPALKQHPPADLRDWDAIRAWVLSLAGRLAGATERVEVPV